MTTNSWHGGWRLDGLVWRPVGVTAEDRFGDVLAEQQLAQRMAELEAEGDTAA